MLAEETQVFFVHRSILTEEGSLESEEVLMLFVWSLGREAPGSFSGASPNSPI